MTVLRVLFGIEEWDGRLGSSEHGPELLWRGVLVLLHALSPCDLRRAVEVEVVIWIKRVVGLGVGVKEDQLLLERENEQVDLLLRGQQGEGLAKGFGHDCGMKVEGHVKRKKKKKRLTRFATLAFLAKAQFE